LKILQVYKDYYPPVKGGIENHINMLATGLKDKGADVQVLVSNVKNQFECDIVNGIPVIKVPQWGRLFSAPLTTAFYCYLKQFGKTADIIHFHHPNPTAEFSYLFTKLKKKVVVTYHSDIIRQSKLAKLYSPFRYMFLEIADRIIAASPNYIKTSDVLKCFEYKCTVIPYGINPARFNSTGDLQRVAQILSDVGHRPIVLFVGRFRYYKGLHFLVSAMKDVDAILFLIGTGPEETRLRNLVNLEKLNGKIRFLGDLPDDDVNAYYKACDVFVLPSHLRSEAFGIVQLEAMCCGKPVISTEIGTGTSFVNINLQTGITVPPNDSRALSGALNYILQNSEKRKLFGNRGSERVARLFTARKMVDSTYEVYEQVIRNHNCTLYRR